MLFRLLIEEKASGNSSFRVDLNLPSVVGNLYPNLGQHMTLRRDTPYTLKFKLKAEGITRFFVIGEFSAKDEEGNSHSSWFPVRFDRFSGSWEEKTVSFETMGCTAHENCTYKFFDENDMDTEYTGRIMFHSDCGTGSYWIDDVVMYEPGFSDLSATDIIKDGGFELGLEIKEPEFELAIEGEEPVKITKLEKGSIDVTAKVKNFTMGSNKNVFVAVALYDGTKLEDVTVMEQKLSPSSVIIPAAAKTGTGEFAILVEGETEGVWIDDVKFIDTVTGENLISNSGFENNGASQSAALDVADGSLEEIYNSITASDTFTKEALESVRGAFKYMTVYNADGIEIDGDMSDWADYPEMSMPTLPTQYQVYINDGKPKDVDAKCKFAQDDENFYMVISVKDDNFVYVTGEDGYWKGDSIQLTLSGLDETYGSEMGFAYNPETGKGEIYGSGFTEEQKKMMTIGASQNEDTTIYEVKIPWKAKFDSRPSKILFDFLVNDNDGDGRRYCAELAPGISEGKINTEFPALEILDGQKDWYAWVEGERKVYTEDEVIYSYYIVNGGEEKSFTVTDMNNQKEEITIPANTGVRREVTAVFDKHGEYDIEVMVNDGDSDYVLSAKTTVERKPPNESYAKGVAEKLKKNSDELKGLIDECEKKDIPVHYEKIDWRVIEKFADYVSVDIGYKDFSRIYYTEETTDELYQTAKANLEAYLSGEKESVDVPKYVTSETKIDGKSVLATVEMNGEEFIRPVFFVGYGHFAESRKDIPIFSDFGANTIQTEIGPSRVLKRDGWNYTVYNNAIASAQGVSEEKKDGDYSLKITFSSKKAPNVYVTLHQTIEVEPGETYVLKGKAKSVSSNRLWVSPDDFESKIDLSGSYEWKEFSGEWTAPSDRTSTIVRILTDDITQAAYIDDVFFGKKDSDENLLSDGSFEKYNEMKFVFDEDSASYQTLLETLEKAEEYNQAVSLLISPHYFVDALADFYGFRTEQGGFLKYIVNHEEALKLIELYLREFIPRIKDYECIDNICISNEPQMFANKNEEFYINDWHEYLKELYNNDIALLNNAYGSAYTSFAAIHMQTDRNVPGKNYDYKIFNDKMFGKWHKFMADIVKELAPEIPLHSKIMGYTASNYSGGMNYNGTGFEEYYGYLDLNGCDYWNYLDDNRGPLVKEMWYDYMNSFKEVPVINSEDHIIPDRNLNYSPEVADYISQDIYQGAIHGRYMSDIWVWEKYLPGISNSTDFIGSISDRPDGMAKIGKATLDLNRLAYEITALQNEVPEVGIIYSNADMLNNVNGMRAAYEAYEASLEISFA